MRFMLFMLPGQAQAAGPGPDIEAFRAMAAFNEEMQKAGVLLDLSGLGSPSEAARIDFKGGTPAVTDGPFAEAKEIVGGYWIIATKTQAEAIEWASRCPCADGAIEVRRILEFDDFPADWKEAASEFPAMKARRERA